MRKFLAVVKREYVQRVRTKFFVVATILGPVLMAGFTIVPAMMFSIKSGGRRAWLSWIRRAKCMSASAKR